MGELDISPREQKALTVIVSRLLRADPQGAADLLGRVTLLWFDWRDRWQEHAASPDVMCDAAKGSDVPPVSALHDDEVAQAIETLRQSGCAREISAFLRELAWPNSITEEERRFLDVVISSLEFMDAGPYR